jgi:NADH:ubiquinone oxidoreductase subunit F (NADH-binding)
VTAVEAERPVGVGTRLTSAPAPDLRTHERIHGVLPERSAAEMLAEVRRAGLTGRGGAAFPAAVKLAAVAGGRGGVVVANGAEGEPGSLKDHRVLLGSPHLVLDGAQFAARAVGASEVVLYLRSDAVAAVRAALDERGRRYDRVRTRVVAAGSGFLSGQESAVVSALSGGPAIPVFRKQRVIERGVGGRPTLVQNVETLAHLALIARHGGAWFADSGTTLVTVHAPGAGPAVWEVPQGVTLGRLLASVGITSPLSAVLVGGYHGTWLPWPAASSVPLSGRTLGAGVVIPLIAGQCGLEATSNIVRWLENEAAGQCGPCRFGLPALAASFSGLLTGSTSIEEVRSAAGLVVGRGACAHPDGTSRLVASALEAFAADLPWHAAGHCLARASGGRS